MNIQFHIHGLNVNATLRDWLEQPLDRLQSLIAVSAAAVVVERQRNSAPAFKAYAVLAVPGPDIHAEARDHTLEAVWLKVTTALRRQILLRKAQQQARGRPKSLGRVPAIGRARSGAALT